MAAPTPYCPQRVATPTMKHNAPQKQPSQLRRKAKLPAWASRREQPEPETSSLWDSDTISRTQSLASVATSASLDSSFSNDDRRSSIPSMSTSSSSFIITPLATPASSRAPSLIQIDEPDDTPTKSWVPNFGKMAKAVVHHGMSISFGDKKSRKKPEPEIERLEAEARRQQWALEQQQRVQECARLCSQWPQSGYNQMKWGPYGSKQYYEPQSYCNPQHVASVMQRQAELERKMCQESALFFSCRPSNFSSPHSSPRLSADLSAAMSESLIPSSLSDSLISSTDSLTSKTSLSDLRSLSMEDRPASVCGFKRPLAASFEEDKRRRVDDMVVEEIVIKSASTPNLGDTVFGHVVKTSDSHPIVISPFLPPELINIISHSVTTSPASPSILVSSVDVPSLLLSFMPSVQPKGPGMLLGNLLLSSCPGKRLRMEGPVKGRGPVCRDLETDLRRIKNEGVGCLVCCLDDSELALLGVPWDTYASVASSIGLDVVRLPMPDGFTPVSLSLFDAQINLIAEKYTLQGINVLVHCRGGVGRAGLTASAWAIKMGFVTPHPSLTLVAEAAFSKLSDVNPHAPGLHLPAELEHQICMSMVERVIAMIRSRRGLKAIESFEQVQFLAAYVKWLRAGR
ncbi:hypothetical protein BD324DRAFT_611927 [Kockovaella imperatae]|uniref:Tyrosine specific protein phosphatases domain-containing protein n=1 Tax=Kockovaella imperatae TaxID=4999 RepID=A0A1Y1UU86_9TREE|nr:hypothetical protein BD324DRAFT_611927 [Kockovaella imperatae]ORX40745.1 hypothetical protein BD324DRAFT_611927 [Kockovaella imperatae]